MKFFVCLLMAAVALGAADVNVTGQWTGNATITRPDGQPREQPVVFNLKQSGAEVTGSVGGNGDQQFPVTKGSIKDDKLALEIQTDGPTVKFDLVVKADKLSGEGTATQEGQTMKVKVDLTRGK